MKKKNKIILIIIILLIILSGVLGIIDYNRVRYNKAPLFMIKLTNTNKKKLNYIGLGYRMQRYIRLTSKEDLNYSIFAKFGGWFYIKDVKFIGEKPHFEKKIIEEKNGFTYSYKPTKKGGQHIFSVSSKVKIKNSPEPISRYNSLNEIERNLGIKLLKSDKLPQNYFWLSNYNNKDKAKITINASNYDKYSMFCEEDCNRPNKALTVSIVFLTQYATEKDIDNNKFYFNDFSATEPDMKIYHSKVLDADIYIDGYPESGSGMCGLMFVYDNMVYWFDGQGFTNDEIVEIIESMKY